MQTFRRAGRGLAVLALFICLLPACGGDGGEAALTPAEYLLRVDDLWCARYAECSGRAPYEACKQQMRIDDGHVRFPWTVEAAASGRITFHPERATACLEAASTASCAAAVGFEWIDWVDPVCLTVFEPAQDEGAPCDHDASSARKLQRECKGWMACDVDNTTCDLSTTCCQGTCSTRNGDQPAQVGEAGASCLGDLDCASELVCGGSGTCVVPERPGDHCSYYCAGDNVCRDGTCQVPDVVSQVTTCGNGTSDTSVCDAAHYCGTDGICWPFAKAGEACGPGVGVCDWFYDCPDDTHVCTLKRQDGEACSVVTECQGRRSLCLDGVCTAPLANGEACSEDARCRSNKCDAGVCRDLDICDVTRSTPG